MEVKNYNLDRKAASKLLKVSMRTVDRYARSKKLSTMVVDGRIWFDKGEVERFRVKKVGVLSGATVDMSTSGLSIDASVDSYVNGVDTEPDKVDSVEFVDREYAGFGDVKRGRKGEMDGLYQKLYVDTKRELEEKQERLEMANYRVGQLEAQLRNSVPMLEYHKENYERKKKEADLQSQLAESSTQLKKTNMELRYERFGKRIFLVFVLLLLALQPLWLLLIYR